jgi:hypothetical protein
MRATLRDGALASYAGRFVWLELNYDNPRNAAFLDSHMNQGYPLLLIVSPSGEISSPRLTPPRTSPPLPRARAPRRKSSARSTAFRKHRYFATIRIPSGAIEALARLKWASAQAGAPRKKGRISKPGRRG